MKRLHERSGSTQPLKEFARSVRDAVAQGIPEYRLDIIRSQTGEEVVSMIRDPAQVGLPQRRDLARVDLPTATICSMNGHGGSPAGRHGGSPAGRHGGSPAETRRITRQKRLLGQNPG